MPPVIISNLNPAGEGGDVTVDEDDLPLGSDTSNDRLIQSGDFNISAPDGVKTLVIGGNDRDHQRHVHSGNNHHAAGQYAQNPDL